MPQCRLENWNKKRKAGALLQLQLQLQLEQLVSRLCASQGFK